MTDPAATILVVDDEPQVQKLLRTMLESQNFRVVLASNGSEALAQASTRNPDVILLDLGLPDMDGLTVAQRLREWSATPIIVISARGRERDEVEALDLGADDYIVKPFGADELLAHVRVALRHAAASASNGTDPVLTFGDLRLDLSARRVFVDDAEVHLTPTEYKLLATLARHAGKVLTHRQLLKEVWGPPYADRTVYLRVYMRQLRHKVERDPARPKYLVNEPGVGYRLKVD